jgi:hypothetical protein
MRKVKFLLMIFAALLVAQISNAQVEHTTFIMPAVWHCFDEPVAGDLEIMNVYHYDKSGNIIKFFFRVKNSWLIGASGATYKLVDVGTVTPEYQEPFPSPEDNQEFSIINNMKIISKGTGKVYDARAQINFVFDKDGDLIVKKDINTTCF